MLEVCSCASVLSVQKRKGGRGELLCNSLVIKSVKKIQRSFPMDHSSLMHGLLKLKEKIILKKQLEHAVGSIQRHSFKEIGLNEMAICIFVGSGIASKTLIFSLPRCVAGQIIGCAPVTQV